MPKTNENKAPADMMRQALLLAQKAIKLGEVPVGAIITDAQQNIIASAHNLVEAQQNASHHAEMLVIQQACDQLGNKYLNNCDLYVTLEPCVMCAGAISHVKLRRLYFGAYDQKSGGVEHGARVFQHSQSHHKPEIYGGILEDACKEVLQQHFATLRQTQK